MNDAVLISIQPGWIELIACGAKSEELRKSRPFLDTPFTCYVYQTRMKWLFELLKYRKLYGLATRLAGALGSVVGEFTCDRIMRSDYVNDTDDPHYNQGLRQGYYPLVDENATCLKSAQILAYGDKKTLYSWHISDFKIYDTPKKLDEFRRYEDKPGKCGTLPIEKAPQSWCYVTKA